MAGKVNQGLYIHNKTGREYLVQSCGKMKVNGEWVDSVNYYYMYDNSVQYTRALDDFQEKFTPHITEVK